MWTMMTTKNTNPRFEWRHNHAIKAGDVLKFEKGGKVDVIKIFENGGVVIKNEYGDKERIAEWDMVDSLRNESVHRVRDGKSKELAVPEK